MKTQARTATTINGFSHVVPPPGATKSQEVHRGGLSLLLQAAPTENVVTQSHATSKQFFRKRICRTQGRNLAGESREQRNVECCASAIHMHPEAGLLAGFLQGFEEVLPVHIIHINVFLAVPAVRSTVCPPDVRAPVLCK